MWVMLDANDPNHETYFKSFPHPPQYNYCVGIFTPDGKFIWDECFEKATDAYKFVSWLNGGQPMEKYE